MKESNNKTHILVVDDDQDIRDLLSDYLTNYQYQVSVAKDGTEMQAILDSGNLDLVLLDIMLPDEDGFTLCRKIRSQSDVPIIILTAVDNETDRVLGLELGADDYQIKPFNPRELLARIKAILRRRGDSGSSSLSVVEQHKIYEFADWKLDTTARHFFSPDNVEITLSSGEYDLLLTFLQRPGRVLNRDQLLELTRHREADPFDRSIDVQVSRLRQKIETDPKHPKLIKTIRNGGYMLTAKVKAV
ncbi:MAG: response regulator transcription factor [Gammaproteobacteria bacterium]|nr:response regulator transcription factor [Gammaproteobacteria bacterium]